MRHCSTKIEKYVIDDMKNKLPINFKGILITEKIWNEGLKQGYFHYYPNEYDQFAHKSYIRLFLFLILGIYIGNTMLCSRKY